MKKMICCFVIMVIGICSAPSFIFAVEEDTDTDGLSNTLEQYYGTRIDIADTDGDGYGDGLEVKHEYSPYCANAWMNECDQDGDGLNDWLERWFGSSLQIVDTDGDGYTDFDEVMRGYSPKEPRGTSIFERRVIVDRTKQRLFYMVDGVKILNYPVSTGNPQTETPAGSFTVTTMIPVKRYVGPGYDVPNVVWNMQFKPMYYLHGAYWHNDFGKRTHSHGCVNLRNADAEVLYTYMNIGVPIDIIGETPAHYVVE